ncbi:hypothetical protein [Streptosporangium sp. NPDC051022]|uniref:hypothetical protein n=1 Tax=Streptosporangium sp. NPDC051022 TaxID=3155752 RepID=UPI003416BDD3
MTATGTASIGPPLSRAAGAATLGSLNVTPAAATEPGWRWCERCTGLWSSWNNDGLSGWWQNGWNFCSKCRGMFYGPLVGRSHCPAGGQHLRGAWSYLLRAA